MKIGKPTVDSVADSYDTADSPDLRQTFKIPHIATRQGTDLQAQYIHSDHASKKRHSYTHQTITETIRLGPLLNLRQGRHCL